MRMPLHLLSESLMSAKRVQAHMFCDHGCLFPQVHAESVLCHSHSYHLGHIGACEPCFSAQLLRTTFHDTVGLECSATTMQVLVYNAVLLFYANQEGG